MSSSVSNLHKQGEIEGNQRALALFENAKMIFTNCFLCRRECIGSPLFEKSDPRIYEYVLESGTPFPKVWINYLRSYLFIRKQKIICVHSKTVIYMHEQLNTTKSILHLTFRGKQYMGTVQVVFLRWSEDQMRIGRDVTDDVDRK